MHIERIQVDGGFLNDLDLHFRLGLNVLIGARGTGKTSLIELIRFGLGAKAFTQNAEVQGFHQATNVLQGGQVTITLRDGEDRWVVTRNERDESPRSIGQIPFVTVLAQGEIEAVGAQSNGRLQLIDRFRPNRAEAEMRHKSHITSLRSLTSEIGSLLKEYSSIVDQIYEMKGVREEKNDALARQQDLLRSIEATADQRQKVEDLRVHAATLSVRDGIYDRTTEKLRDYSESLKKIEEGVREIEEWPSSAGDTDLLDRVRIEVEEAALALSKALGIIRNAKTEVDALKKKNSGDRINAEETARSLRGELDKLDDGAGELTRTVNALAEREAQLGVLEELAEDRSRRIAELQELRRHAFQNLEKDRRNLFESRKEILNDLRKSLSPEIKTEITQSGMQDEYTDTLIAALRGSGLRYNSLAPHMTSNMTPLEIVEAVESNDSQAITDATDINTNRAANVIAHLKTRNLSDLITAPVNDAVELFLLDGANYKKSDSLSIGQRCTAVLPFLLSGHGELLIIDQPEDHLDNAFIADTLIDNLRARHRHSQFIFASHNANIPVLGEADLVVRLGSDGSRGFVQHKGQLDEQETAIAITSLMEGGAEAFRRRAEFYGRVLDDGHG
ncbi:MAG: AAA family ATPase [Caldilineaceae bacterium]|nr:AAA family ATPase [Caldilineaceae bacterium]